MRTACSLGASGTTTPSTCACSGVHLVAQRRLLRVEPAELLGDPARGPGPPRCRRSRGAACGARVNRTLCRSRRGVQAAGRRGAAAASAAASGGHSVTSPSTVGPGRLGAKTSLEMRRVGTPCCTQPGHGVLHHRAGPGDADLAAESTGRAAGRRRRCRRARAADTLSSETATVTVSQGCSCCEPPQVGAVVELVLGAEADEQVDPPRRPLPGDLVDQGLQRREPHAAGDEQQVPVGVGVAGEVPDRRARAAARRRRRPGGPARS